MNILNRAALFISFMLIAAYAYSGDYAAGKMPPATPSVETEGAVEGSVAAVEDTATSQAETRADYDDEAQAQDRIKTKTVCIGEDCRSKWPSLKCANYDKRPAGETGDAFCGRMNQTCVAVSIGNGQTFFDECSVAATSVHRCRCCWVE